MTTRKRYLLGAGVAALSLTLGLAGCNIEQTEKGELPSVDMQATKGQMPDYEVKQTREGKLPDVDIDVQAGHLPEFEVETPDVEVGKKKVEVTVPTVDIEMPRDDE